MNRKIVLSLAFVLVISMFSGITSCFAAANVGVVVGQSYEYTSADSGTRRDIDGNLTDSLPYTVGYLETITVLQVSGTNVTIEFERELMNGTTTSGTSWVDLNTGAGTAWFVVIPAGLGTGSLIYPDWVDENGTTENAPTITSTVFINDGDSLVRAVHLGFGYTDNDVEYTHNYFWEQSTGMLLKYVLTGTADAENITTFSITHLNRVGLEQVFYPLIDSEDYPVSITSDSNILDFEFKQDEKQLLLNVSGKTGTLGSCEIAIPENLLWGSFILNMDGYALEEDTDYTQTSNGTHQIFDINYVHSTHSIEITATETIPEFSTMLLVSLFLISSLVAVAVYRKRLVRSTA